MVKTGDGPGIDGGLMQRQQPGQPPNNVIDVPSLAESTKKIWARAAQEIVPKMGIPGVGWVAYFTDTEQNVFGLMEYDARKVKPSERGKAPLGRRARGFQRAATVSGYPCRVCRSPRRTVGAGAVRSADAEIRRAAFGDLAQGYWRPSYHYLRLHWRLAARRRRGRRAGVLHRRLREALRRGATTRPRPGSARSCAPASIGSCRTARRPNAPQSEAARPKSARSISRARSGSSPSIW